MAIAAAMYKKKKYTKEEVYEIAKGIRAGDVDPAQFDPASLSLLFDMILKFITALMDLFKKKTPEEKEQAADLKFASKAVRAQEKKNRKAGK